MSFDHRLTVRPAITMPLLAGGVPFLIYLLTASGYAHWLDSGELVAAAADFGISHPPGHPLASIVLGAAHLLPVGALSFRVAVICSALGAVAALALFSACVRTLRASGAIREAVIPPLCLAATWWVAASQAWWFQAVRPEVYALQGALVAIAVERLVCVAASGARGDVRPLYQAALAMGLALANHHYLALAAFIPAVWLLLGVFALHGWRPLGWSLAFVLAGLGTYVFLPIRAFTDPYLNLGEPSSPARFAWVVSARAFQKSVGPERVAPFFEHLADVLVAMGQDLHIAVLLVALLGAYFSLRVPRARKYGLFWLTMWLTYTGGRAILGFVHDNPDALAYMMMSYAAVAVFCAFALGLVLSAVSEAAPERRRLAPILAVLVAAGSLFQLGRSYRGSSLADFADTDVFDDGLRRRLPQNAVILAHNPSTIFRFWGGEAEELNRPDLTLVPLPLSSYPKLVEHLVEASPELKPVLRSYLLDGVLHPSDLQSLATDRPVFVEMDVRVPPDRYETLVPQHLYHRVLTSDLTAIDEAESRQAHAVLMRELEGRLGAPLDAQTAVQLLWRHYTDALYFAGVGDIEAARASISAGRRLNPHATELLAMEQALEQARSGEAIDVTPFLVR